MSEDSRKPNDTPDARRREAEKLTNEAGADTGFFSVMRIPKVADEPTDDPAVRWGRRTGRLLWLIALAFVIYGLIRYFLTATGGAPQP